ASYAVHLFKSSYDVIARGRTSLQNVLPLHRTLVAADRALNQSGVYDIDLETVNITGTVTLNGSVMPDNTATTQNYDRGYLIFVEKGTGDSVDVGLGRDGPASYAVHLFKSGYDVIARGRTSLQDVLPEHRTLVYLGCE
ncbi:MAG: hypothetical protein ACNA8W_17220, partial [Bradymonadaceae bacterium]